MCQSIPDYSDLMDKSVNRLVIHSREASCRILRRKFYKLESISVIRRFRGSSANKCRVYCYENETGAVSATCRIT